MSKLSNLKKGLEGLDARASKANPDPALVARASRPASTPKPPSRIGTRNIAANLSPAFKSSLRAVQMQNDKPVQHLIAEALNLLFEKYNVPTVSE